MRGACVSFVHLQMLVDQRSGNNRVEGSIICPECFQICHVSCAHRHTYVPVTCCQVHKHTLFRSGLFLDKHLRCDQYRNRKWLTLYLNFAQAQSTSIRIGATGGIAPNGSNSNGSNGSNSNGSSGSPSLHCSSISILVLITTVLTCLLTGLLTGLTPLSHF